MSTPDFSNAESDWLCRFVAGVGVRGVIVRLGEAWRQIRQRAAYPDGIAKVLGELTAASALLAGDIQMAGHVSVQIKGQHGLRLAFAECRSNGDLRGLARYQGDPVQPLAVAEMVGATMAISIERQPSGQRYQGLVPTTGTTLAECLQGYFAQSEQLPTAIQLYANADAAAGLLLQRVADTGGTRCAGESLDFDSACLLAATLRAEEIFTLDAETVLRRLFAEHDLRLFEPLPLRFCCSCSRQRVAAMLQALGRAEAFAALGADGRVGVDCEFCNQHYAFDSVDLEQILRTGTADATSLRSQ